MKTFANIIVKFFASNMTVIIAIGLLPAFLVTDEIPLFNQLIDYLFNNKS